MTVQTVPAFLQNASHPAAVFRQAVSAPFASGGKLSPPELAVYAQNTPNMSVQVNAGRAQVPGTNVSAVTGFNFTTQGQYNVLNDGIVSVTVAAADATNPRIDVVYIGVQDSYYSGGTNTALISVVTGVPASTPVAPAIPSNSILLATVAVAANAPSIVTGNIANTGTVAELIQPLTNFQADTSNSRLQTITQAGIGKITGNGSTAISEPLAFPISFTSIPAVTVSFIGARATGAYNPSGLSAVIGAYAQAQVPALGGVNIYLSGATFSAADDYYYSWIAVGAA